MSSRSDPTLAQEHPAVLPWLNEDLAPNGRVVRDNFHDWFGKSQIRDAMGMPLVVHHGTGARIDAFDPTMTGLGNDQFGSGFYFTTDVKQAMGYQSARLSWSTAEKLGGTDCPNTIHACLSIQKPICLSASEENLRGILVTPQQAEKIIVKAPDVFDPDNSPLVNWIDHNGRRFNASDVRKIAKSYSELMSIENDFFSGSATAFREVVHAVTGFDGVEKTFPDGSRHFVAWFPEQIKSIHNAGLFLKNSPSITDADAALALTHASKAKLVAQPRERHRAAALAG
jgi:hypothetical protein